jgi:hypothetical protein
MTPNREHNYCCNGGAGGMRLTENTELRRKISVLKANQIRNTGAESVTTPCVVCTLSLEDTCKTYGLARPGERMALVMFEVVYEAMEQALAKRGELARMLLPAELAGRDAEFFAAHSISGWMEVLIRQPEFLDLLDWLEHDEIVQRFARDHPLVADQLRELRALAARSGEVLELGRPPEVLEQPAETVKVAHRAARP